MEIGADASPQEFEALVDEAVAAVRAKERTDNALTIIA
jgi:hypothetical protein